jgi:hypothetical protein
MIGAGVELSLGEVLAAVRSLVAGFEVDGLAAHEAAQVVEDCAEAERLLGVLRVMAAATLEDKALWRREGFRSVAQWMASKTGTAVGPAIATMEMATLLADLDSQLG